MGRVEAIIWENEGNPCVLAPDLSCTDKALCLLRAAPGWMDVKRLCEGLGYANRSRFRAQILPPMHRKGLIVFDRHRDRVILTPLGKEQSEIKRMVSDPTSAGLDRETAMVVADDSAGRALCELFVELFGPDELRRFVTHRYTRVAVELPERDSQAGLAFATSQCLERHGLISPEFFAALLEERPRQFKKVAACADRWGIKMRVS